MSALDHFATGFRWRHDRATWQTLSGGGEARIARRLFGATWRTRSAPMTALLEDFSFDPVSAQRVTDLSRRSAKEPRSFSLNPSGRRHRLFQPFSADQT